MPTRRPTDPSPSHNTDRDPALEWAEGKLPVSSRFGDSYYTAPRDGLDGRDETGEVFISGNGLPERWARPGHFTIAELGFGTGLNFLETVVQWLDTAPTRATLHYTAFEQYPLTRGQVLEALSPWPDLQQLAHTVFLPKHQDFHGKTGWLRHNFPLQDDKLQDGKAIALTLAIGDANSLLPDWHDHNTSPVDAWYLDGFSPAKNPELWNPALMQAVSDITAQDGTFSTYTSAGHVRRALQDAGFSVRKVKGFGRKRHRLEGIKS